MEVAPTSWEEESPHHEDTFSFLLDFIPQFERHMHLHFSLLSSGKKGRKVMLRFSFVVEKKPFPFIPDTKSHYF